MRKYIKRRKSFTSVFPMITIFGMIIFGLCSYYQPDWHFDWNGIRQEIKDSILVAKNYGIDTKHTGSAGNISNQYKRQQWLIHYASRKELEKLITYPSSTIKVIAYEGLLRNPLIKNKFSIILKAISDKDNTSKIYYSIGCYIERIHIDQYLLENVLFENRVYDINNRKIKEIFGFTDAQTDYILTEYNRIKN